MVQSKGQSHDNSLAPSDGNRIVFTGLELYQVLKAHLLGEPEQRDAIAAYQEFLSRHFFESERVTLIPREGDNTVHVLIGRDRQRPIYQLGDGLQNLIIITYNMFAESKRCLFFIEEPDMCMHPGLQRALLEAMNEIDHHQYFLTSHSNHCLDMTLDYSDLSLYLLKKEHDAKQSRFHIKLVSRGDRALLRELGVQNASVFLTDTTIWVEGITDRLYMREYLRKYLAETQHSFKEELTEDIHYAFVEYQGSNLVHWSFDPNGAPPSQISALSVCGDAIIIADGDIATKGDRAAIYSKMLGERFIRLHCKEIENLLPEEIVRLVVATEFRAVDKSTDLVTYKDYSQSMTGIGEYLDTLMGRACFASQTGTIKNKMGFCEKAIAYMQNEKWVLPEPVKDICKSIVTHMCRSYDGAGPEVASEHQRVAQAKTRA